MMVKVLTELPLDNAPDGAIFSAADNPAILPPFGDWGLVTWLHGVNFEWRVTQDAGRKVLEHSTTNTSALRSGDGSWGDFTLEFGVRQMRANADTSMDEVTNTRGRSGLMFRYQTYRQAYALFIESMNRVVLYCRVEHDWIELASRVVAVDRERYYRFKVECEGDKILVDMDGTRIFDVTDSTYRRGRAAVFANTLSRFADVRVTINSNQEGEMKRFISSEREIEKASGSDLAQPVLWKRIYHPRPSGNRTLDVSPRGDLCGVVVVTDDHKYAERDGVALVSIDTNGGVRWSRACSKKAFPRVWDLDGDGRQEIVLYDGPMLRLIDSETGQVKNEAPTPSCNRLGNRGGREDQTPFLPIYMMFPANVRGKGPGRDIVLFDIYTGIWVVNDSLEMVWCKSCEHGHDIGLYDIDGDGCDEVLCGYTLFDHDGSEMWTVADVEYQIFALDHVDHIAIGEFDENVGNGLEIALTCGNAGFYLLDQEGKVRVHHDVGHAQSLQVGQYRPDLPGSQFLVGCRWGNPGTRVLFGGNGERLWTIEPDNSYASDLPVRWADDRDVICVLSTPQAAGFYDGFGRRVMGFPDPHLTVMDRAHSASDFIGNGLEDVVVMAADSVLVYTQDGIYGKSETRRTKPRIST